ncbi:NYN domain-containing protein [Rhodoferax ferrireducens]|uniref:NYN domain-containing protein n=1 Tax=Rhodoferax ferrireducens TaxID=192843 RepID=UPI000E0D9FC6|nr:NYN domain-containing protein [Rhodoferax ferrireducens]
MVSPKVHLFVDNSNLKVEGARLAYAKRINGGKRSKQTDDSYEIDWGKFIHLVKSRGDRLLAQVPVLYGSRPPPDDSVWQQIRNEGFDVKLFDRNIRDKEKGVDMEMGMDVVERFFEVNPPATMVIAAGDADFKGMVERAKKRGWAVEVWFWGNAAVEMQNVANYFDIDKAFDYLKKGGGVPLPPKM